MSNPSLTAVPTVSTTISDKALIRAQAGSGLAFAVFLALHLINLVAASLGQATYDAVQDAFRVYYQFPLVEIVLVLGAALVHIAASLLRIGRRRRAQAGRKPKVSLRVRLHRYSAYYLLTFFVGHVIATRLPSLLGHPADFSMLNYSLTLLPYYFYPYYALLAFAGFYHLTHGVIVGLRVFQLKLPRAFTAPTSPAFWAWAAIVATLSVTSLLALGGVFFEVDTSRLAEWEALTDRVLQLAN